MGEGEITAFNICKLVYFRGMLYGKQFASLRASDSCTDSLLYFIKLAGLPSFLCTSLTMCVCVRVCVWA